MASRGFETVAAGRLRALLAGAALLLGNCSRPDPLLSFLDAESSMSFTHPPRWSVAFADQNGMRYRYLTAPKVDNDKEALSITLIPSTEGATVDAVAHAYLAGASEVTQSPGSSGATEWSFKDSSGVLSRLRLVPAPVAGQYFGAWVRGPESAFIRYKDRLATLLSSLRVEDVAQWKEDKFAGMTARVPRTWTSLSRLSNQTNGSMQFKSLPLGVDKGTDTVHGFITISKEPVPAPGDLAAFNKLIKDRASDTVSLVEHKPWPAIAEGQQPTGFMDFLRSGNTMTTTRIRRWITVKNGVGLTFACEARVDVYDRLDPWCRRMADTVRLD